VSRFLSFHFCAFAEGDLYAFLHISFSYFYFCDYIAHFVFSHFTFHISHFTFHISHFTFHISHFTFSNFCSSHFELPLFSASVQLISYFHISAFLHISFRISTFAFLHISFRISTFAFLHISFRIQQICTSYVIYPISHISLSASPNIL